jgi:hypothetical protein
MSEPDPELLIQKHAAYIEVPEELLMDYGAIPDTRAHRTVPKRTRMRWWLAGKRTRAAELAYHLIAGEDPPQADGTW